MVELWSNHKKKESDNGKFKKLPVFYTLGLVLILSRLPWANWFNQSFGIVFGNKFTKS